MKFKKKVLDNGLTILFEKRDVNVTTVMLGVRYGSAYDSFEEKGMAHFIEHLCFKGTKKRAAKEIVYEVERVGGDINAFTHEEVTAYHVRLPSNYLGIAMDVVFDIFFNSVFPKDKIETEASVICEEIKMYKDNPMKHSFDKIKDNLYEEPFGYTGLGRAEAVKNMTRNQIVDKHKGVYVPENSILCVVGNNDFDEVVSLAEKFVVKRDVFIDFEKPKVVLRNIQDDEKRGDLQQANVVLGFHFPRASEKESYAADIFSAILGGGMSSKLFTEVREKRGLVYGVKSDLDLGKDYGYMIIWAGTDSSKVDEVKKICLDEFHKMKDLTDKELEQAKIQVIGNRKVENEGSSETATNLMLKEISGDASDYYSYKEKIMGVTLQDIKELAMTTEFASFILGP